MQFAALSPAVSNPDFGVYIHWPFCAAKCPYCDFNSHVWREIDQDAWATGLLTELRHMHRLSGSRSVDTVFFGGGTPSLMPARTVALLIAEIDRLWGLAPGAEITLEANPTSVEAGRFQGYASAGVNRVSMGVQSLRDADLKALGRLHTADEARAAFDVARAVFDRVSFDLIYARSGQTVSAWEAELGEALAMAVDHLSLYQLTIEPGTRFFDLHASGRLTTPSDGRAADMYALTQQMTASAGLPAYEISNHARPGAESRHNLIYWRYGDYAGIGPGAHGRLTIGGSKTALSTLRDPAAWLQQVSAQSHGIGETEDISGPDQAAEYLMMSLRLSEGTDLRRIEALSGTAVCDSRVGDLVLSGHLLQDGSRLRTTNRGRIVLNSVLDKLLS